MNLNAWSKTDPTKDFFSLPNQIYSLCLLYTSSRRSLIGCRAFKIKLENNRSNTL